MKNLIFYFFLLTLFVSCSSDETMMDKDQTINVENVSNDIVSFSSSKKMKKNVETGYFYVRVDSRVPETYDEEQFISLNMVDYYPQNDGKTDFGFSSMQKKIYVDAIGEKEYLLDRYGKYTQDAFVEGYPGMNAIIESFKGGDVTYHNEVIYSESQGINKLDDYKVIWYVVKRVDEYIHVDGALVPIDKDKVDLIDNDKKDIENKGEDVDKTNDVDIIIPIDVDKDIVLEVDDFDIRKSVIDEYVAYEKDSENNQLTFNDVIIYRGDDMKLCIDNIDALDWSDKNTIWTFDAYLWTKEYIDNWSQDDAEYIIDNDKYLIECHTYKGYQSNYTVPYLKISVHISLK